MRSITAAWLVLILSVGFSPQEEGWTVILLDHTIHSDLLLIRLEGAHLVTFTGADTLLIPIASITEIYTSSHPLGVPGWLIGFGAGAAIGAGIVLLADEDGDSRLEGLAVAGCASLGASAGAVVGCLFLPEKETRYQLGGKTLVTKEMMIREILLRHSH